MGADNHSTTRVETESKDVRETRLMNDLAGCRCVEGVRKSMLAGLVVETSERGFEPDALAVLSEHNARIGTNKARDDPWEVFLE
jgi:hypothetical protein